MNINKKIEEDIFSCTQLTQIPPNLFTNINAISFQSVFSSCTSLSSFPFSREEQIILLRKNRKEKLGKINNEKKS